MEILLPFVVFFVVLIIVNEFSAFIMSFLTICLITPYIIENSNDIINEYVDKITDVSIFESAYYIKRELERFEDETGENAFDLLKLTTKDLTDTENYFGVLDIVYSQIEPYEYLRYDLRYEYDHGVEGTIPAIDKVKVDDDEYLTYIVYDLNKVQCKEINDINKEFNNINPVRFEDLGNKTDFVCIKDQMKTDSYTFYYIIYENYFLF